MKYLSLVTHLNELYNTIRVLSEKHPLSAVRLNSRVCYRGKKWIRIIVQYVIDQRGRIRYVVQQSVLKSIENNSGKLVLYVARNIRKIKFVAQ